MPEKISPFAMDGREQIFSWAGNDGVQIHFAVEQILALAKEHEVPIMQIAIDEEFARNLPETRDLEPHRLLRLGNDPSRWEPVIFCHIPEENSFVLVDGSHRVYIAWKLGYKDIRAYLVPKPIWEYFLVDLPDGKLKGFSGIL